MAPARRMMPQALQQTAPNRRMMPQPLQETALPQQATMPKALAALLTALTSRMKKQEVVEMVLTRRAVLKATPETAHT